MAALPLLKLSALFVKTIAKPLTNQLQTATKTRPRLADFFASCGNAVNYVYSRSNVIAAGHKFVGVKPLPRDQAIADGVSILSETIVVGFSTGVIIIDSMRSSRANAIKAEKAAEEKKQDAIALEQRFLELERKVEEARKERNSWILWRNDHELQKQKENEKRSTWWW